MLIIFVLLTIIIPNVSAPSPLHYKYTISYVFENKGTKPLNLTKEDLSVPIFMKDVSKVSKITDSSHSLIDEYKDDDGNGWLVVNVSRMLNPGKQISYFVTYEIESYDKTKPTLDHISAGVIEDIPNSLTTELCRPTSTFLATNTQILAKAQELTNSTQTVLGKVMNLLGWFTSNINYGTYEVPRYANDTFKHLEGDCDDQAILLISMLRGLGIPAYMEVGTYFMPGYEATEKSWEGHLEIEAKGIGWHGWAIVYIPPWGWVPVDMTLSTNPDPLKKLNEAPEYSNLIVTCFNVSKQEYIKESWNTRERVIESTLYVTSKDEAVQIFNQPLFNPTIQILGACIGGLIIIQYYFERRRQQYPI
jgi:transglutaminase-like putative cysteine protease